MADNGRRSTGWFAKRLASIVALAMLSFLAAGRLTGPAEAASDSKPAATATPAAPAPMKLAIGDKLKIEFYERLSDSEDRYSTLNKPTKPELSFYLHQELSGDFTVQSDWRISVPLLGSFIAAGADVNDLSKTLSAAFEQLMHRPGFVNVDRVSRQPIYVVGPVKQPGSYRYEPGITILHAVSLAGGFRQVDVERFAAIEALRESGKANYATNRLRRILAEKAVLTAELQGSVPAVPEQLLQIASGGEAQALVSTVVAERTAIVRARDERRQALSLTLSAAEQARSLAKDRVGPTEVNVQGRRTRYAGLQTLVKKGAVSEVMLSQAQSDLTDAINRDVDVQKGVIDAEQNAALARVELAKFKSDTQAELTAEISAHQKEIDELTPSLAAGSGIVSSYSGDGNSEITGDGDVAYEVVRQTADGPKLLPAEATTSLQPGDLVRIRLLVPRTRTNATAISIGGR